MPYKMSEKQFAEVLALDCHERFVHFLDKIADWQQAWGVKNEEGWLVPTAPEEFEYFPLWPHPDYATKSSGRGIPRPHRN